MSVIPQSVYRLVERRLKDRWELEAKARAKLYDAQQAALSLASPGANPDEGHASGPGNRTQAMALLILEAEEQLETAMKWAEAIRLTDAAFPWESTSEGVIA